MTREEMREKVARSLCWNRAGPACDCRARGIPCRGRVENLLDESSEFSKQADAAIALVLEEAARVAVTPCPVVPHPRECQRCANSKLKYKSPRDAAAAIRALKEKSDE